MSAEKPGEVPELVRRLAVSLRENLTLAGQKFAFDKTPGNLCGMDYVLAVKYLIKDLDEARLVEAGTNPCLDPPLENLNSPLRGARAMATAPPPPAMVRVYHRIEGWTVGWQIGAFGDLWEIVRRPHSGGTPKIFSARPSDLLGWKHMADDTGPWAEVVAARDLTA